MYRFWYRIFMGCVSSPSLFALSHDPLASGVILLNNDSIGRVGSIIALDVGRDRHLIHVHRQTTVERDCCGQRVHGDRLHVVDRGIVVDHVITADQYRIGRLL